MGFGLAELKPFGIMRCPSTARTLMISRTGLYRRPGLRAVDRAPLALALWDALYAAGADYGIQPYGEAATNMARLEAGFLMPYMEFNEALKTVNFEYDQTPFELGLGWLVDFKKPHFNGRAALLKQQREGLEAQAAQAGHRGQQDRGGVDPLQQRAPAATRSATSPRPCGHPR
jgi:aminomethyltransferase